MKVFRPHRSSVARAVANPADELPNRARQVVEMQQREIRRLQLPTAHHSPNQNIVARQNDGQAKSQMRRKVRQDRFRRRIASEDLSVSGSARQRLWAQVNTGNRRLLQVAEQVAQRE